MSDDKERLIRDLSHKLADVFHQELGEKYKGSERIKLQFNTVGHFLVCCLIATKHFVEDPKRDIQRIFEKLCKEMQETLNKNLTETH